MEEEKCVNSSCFSDLILRPKLFCSYQYYYSSSQELDKYNLKSTVCFAKVINLPFPPTLPIMPSADTSSCKQVTSHKASDNLMSLHKLYDNIAEWRESQLLVILKSTRTQFWASTEQFIFYLPRCVSTVCFLTFEIQRVSVDQNLPSCFRKHIMLAKGIIFITVCCLTALDSDQIYSTYKRQDDPSSLAKNFDFQRIKHCKAIF